MLLVMDLCQNSVDVSVIRSLWDKIEFMFVFLPVPHVSDSCPRVLKLFPWYGWCRETVVWLGVMFFYFCLTLCTDELQECFRWLFSQSQAALMAKEQALPPGTH